MGSISFREHIRWIPDEASEPTSTIVLTSPQRRFVDLRILKSAPTADAAQSEFPSTTSPPLLHVPCHSPSPLPEDRQCMI